MDRIIVRKMDLLQNRSPTRSLRQGSQGGASHHAGGQQRSVFPFQPPEDDDSSFVSEDTDSAGIQWRVQVAVKSLRYFVSEDPEENQRKLESNNKVGSVFDLPTHALTSGGRFSAEKCVF
ncbi:hypothetical protein JVT61DRAFT_11039 [Boletus reticuloceps]|uniref:Uncharacterized protein n=1 Tax=Boletus reticuloceps TaxID=495285 RepID=A0A8I2YFC3_9AGAM|nr:hypothetical protein JVT61DRAFT_11039 [Boletus reticuloceps]